MQQKIILVVEDDPDLLKMTVYALRPFGCQVETAANGAEALELLDLFQPDLIILNLSFPFDIGEAFIETIHTRPDLAHTQIIVVTVFGSEHTHHLQGEVDYIFQKPYNLGELRAAVEQSLSVA